MTPVELLPNADADPAAGAGADAIEIRHVRTHDEFVACFEMQTATWGAAFRELVPATILKVSQRIGGVTAGAFAPDGALLGFVFGMTGIERGAVVHWSDLLAVRPDAQNHGIGRRLKEFQRDAVRALGAERMYWTYDPLVARNAHFNLNRLGARVAEYVPDMYGADTGSALHSGVGTDRFIVVWPIAAGDGVPARRGTVPNVADAPVLNAHAAEDSALDTASPVVRIEVPTDITRVQAESMPRAAQWRRSTRRCFQSALAAGYVVDHFTLDEATGRGFYVLVREADAGAPKP